MSGGRYLNDSGFKCRVSVSVGLLSCYASDNLVANSRNTEIRHPMG